MKENEVIEKKKKERFDLLPTFFPDIRLKVEPGTKLKIPSKILVLLCDLAQTFSRKQWKIDSARKRQEERREEIIDIAKANNGLRGIISEKNNFNLTVSPSEHIIWNEAKLRKSVGKWRSMVINRTFIVNITLPTPYILKGTPMAQKEIIEKAIKKALCDLRIPKEDTDRLIKTKTSINVDEQFLDSLIAGKTVKLLPGTKKSEITWKVRVDPLRSK
ncbi:MAG: hypothetical protein NTU58_00315 [Candidatus Nealsonbacteria bacterium]|nr:hypothetical protein [Candidatus Nealsonbacteria bacterium]